MYLLASTFANDSTSITMVDGTEVLNVTPIPDLFFKFDALERQSEIAQRKKVFKEERIFVKAQKKCISSHRNLRPIIQPRKVS